MKPQPIKEGRQSPPPKPFPQKTTKIEITIK